MQKYVIERDLPGAGKLSPAELQAISQKSNDVLRGMGTKIQWVQSYVTQDKIYCVYLAENEADIRSHAKAGGFPANRVSRIMTMIDPTSGN
jgi:Nickel responsive protein SCO4226-like